MLIQIEVVVAPLENIEKVGRWRKRFEQSTKKIYSKQWKCFELKRKNQLQIVFLEY